VFSNIEGTENSISSSFFDDNTPKQPLLNSINSGGLGIEFQFSRDLSSYGSNFNVIRLFIQNLSNGSIKSIQISDFDSSNGKSLQKFNLIKELTPNQLVTSDLNIDFNGNRSEFKFEISTENQQFKVSITPPPGELLIPFNISDSEFNNQRSKLKGLNQVDQDIQKLIPIDSIINSVTKYSNVSVIREEDDEFFILWKNKIKRWKTSIHFN